MTYPLFNLKGDDDPFSIPDDLGHRWVAKRYTSAANLTPTPAARSDSGSYGTSPVALKPACAFLAVIEALEASRNAAVVLSNMSNLHSHHFLNLLAIRAFKRSKTANIKRLKEMR
jgi:hypothetical protein